MGIQVLTAFIVLLTDIMQHGDLIPRDTTLEVEKRLADQWKGVGIARAATDEEIAEYQGDAAEAEELLGDVDGLAEQKRQLEQAITGLEGQRSELLGEVEDLGRQRLALKAEVEKLEAAKVAAEKPATAAKPK